MRIQLLTFLLVGFAGPVPARGDLPTPLELAEYNSISTAAAVGDYLHLLARRYPRAHVEQLGKSAQGRPIEALVVAHDGAASERLRVMLIGSQHGGAEPAGGEALLEVARDLLAGTLKSLQKDLDFVLIPDPNPDGRNAGRRGNGAGINLNTDFVLLESPEAQALAQALRTFAPQVVLDAHESAVLKRKSLAREGYLTDFNLQFERANHPALPEAAAALNQSLLDAVLAKLQKAGIESNRYVGEITTLKQPVTNGGLGLRNLRNTAAMGGAFSFLVETRLDSREDVFDTYRNIGPRVARQLVGVHAFLAVVHARRAEILATAATARSATRTEAVTLFADYTLDESHPATSIRLRKRDGGREETRTFADHRAVATADRIPMPSTYVVVEHADEIARVLERHGIVFEATPDALASEVTVSRFTVMPDTHSRATQVSSEEREVLAPPGSLVIDLAQARGRLAVLLLDPRSNSSIFRFPRFAAMVQPDRDFFVHAVSKGVRRQ